MSKRNPRGLTNHRISFNCHQKTRFRHFQLGAPFPTLLGTLWAPFWLLIGSQDGPKSLQDRPKMAPRRPKTPPSRLLEPSRIPAATPRSLPELLRGLQEAPGTLQGSILTFPGAIWSSILAPKKARSPCRTILGTLTCNLWLQGLGRRVSAKRIQFAHTSSEINKNTKSPSPNKVETQNK